MTVQLAFDFDTHEGGAARRTYLCDCGRVAITRVYGFAWLRSRRAYVGAGDQSNRLACLGCLDDVTLQVKMHTWLVGLTDPEWTIGRLIVWSRLPLQPDIPGTESSWHEVQQVAA